MPSSRSQRTARTTWENGLTTMPTAAYLAAEGISPTTGPRREGKRKTPRCLLSLHVACGVCNEVWWRPCPTNLPPPFHKTVVGESCSQLASNEGEGPSAGTATEEKETERTTCRLRGVFRVAELTAPTIKENFPRRPFVERARKEGKYLARRS